MQLAHAYAFYYAFGFTWRRPGRAEDCLRD
jgi:hypothetical protein